MQLVSQALHLRLLHRRALEAESRAQRRGRPQQDGSLPHVTEGGRRHRKHLRHVLQGIGGGHEIAALCKPQS